MIWVFGDIRHPNSSSLGLFRGTFVQGFGLGQKAEWVVNASLSLPHPCYFIFLSLLGEEDFTIIHLME